ncbi:hypothetical protein Zmor_012306 [Zophobas morio]|jgi:hypothetical protein|uniref:Uncharacterized protein n=1 Tax=Zophobas morio TaxID=2755281 RepID=A0AA38HGP6_9CUCU|nr:hypothetical protein Zmor_012306 [Zophobas morio]
MLTAAEDPSKFERSTPKGQGRQAFIMSSEQGSYGSPKREENRLSAGWSSKAVSSSSSLNLNKEQIDKEKRSNHASKPPKKFNNNIF